MQTKDEVYYNSKLVENVFFLNRCIRTVNTQLNLFCVCLSLFRVSTFWYNCFHFMFLFICLYFSFVWGTSRNGTNRDQALSWLTLAPLVSSQRCGYDPTRWRKCMVWLERNYFHFLRPKSSCLSFNLICSKKLRDAIGVVKADRRSGMYRESAKFSYLSSEWLLEEHFTGVFVDAKELGSVHVTSGLDTVLDRVVVFVPGPNRRDAAACIRDRGKK